ncbi:hypothetical protein D3C74_469530 [compost metagenome]
MVNLMSAWIICILVQLALENHKYLSTGVKLGDHLVLIRKVKALLISLQVILEKNIWIH